MSRKLPWSWLNLFLQFSCPCQLTSLLRLFLLEDLKHIGVSFPCDLLQLVVPSLKVVVGLGAAHQESSPPCFKLTFTSLYLYNLCTTTLHALLPPFSFSQSWDLPSLFSFVCFSEGHTTSRF